jgi:hypothetical protein
MNLLNPNSFRVHFLERSRRQRRISYCHENAQGEILRCAQDDSREAFFRSLGSPALPVGHQHTWQTQGWIPLRAKVGVPAWILLILIFIVGVAQSTKAASLEVVIPTEGHLSSGPVSINVDDTPPEKQPSGFSLFFFQKPKRLMGNIRRVPVTYEIPRSHSEGFFGVRQGIFDSILLFDNILLNGVKPPRLTQRFHNPRINTLYFNNTFDDFGMRGTGVEDHVIDGYIGVGFIRRQYFKLPNGKLGSMRGDKFSIDGSQGANSDNHTYYSHQSENDGGNGDNGFGRTSADCNWWNRGKYPYALLIVLGCYCSSILIGGVGGGVAWDWNKRHLWGYAFLVTGILFLALGFFLLCYGWFWGPWRWTDYLLNQGKCNENSITYKFHSDNTISLLNPPLKIPVENVILYLIDHGFHGIL